MNYIFTAFVSYLIGSIPFGLVLTRLGGYGDIRDIGSGNIGATNVLRTGNRKLALVTLILDGVKGIIAILLCAYLQQALFSDFYYKRCEEFMPDSGIIPNCNGAPGSIQSIIYLSALFSVIGHMFPIWLKFKGGKGVATTLGVLLVTPPIIPGVIACVLWLVSAIVTRYSSLSALIAVASTPIISFLFIFWHDYQDWQKSIPVGAPKEDFSFSLDWSDSPTLCLVLAALVFYKHRANIQRLVKGEEPKIGQKK